MCQCGCGERPVEQAYELTNKCIMGVKVYDGCADCFQGLAVDLSFYDSPKVEWLEHLAECYGGPGIDQSIKPNEFGGTNPANGLPLPIIDVKELKAQAAELLKECPLSDFRRKGISVNQSLMEWLDEHGFELLQGAARKFAVKRAEQVSRLKT